MKTLNEIEKVLKEKLEENQLEIQNFGKKIQEAEESIEQANAELLIAENEVNVDTYNNVKNDVGAAKHAKELYLKQQEKLKQLELVTKAEYNQLLAEITQVADDTHDKQNERVIELIIEIRDISQESAETSVQANALMQLLQRKVFKEPEGKISLSNGMTTWSSDKTYRKQETAHGFYNISIKGTSLAQRAGEETEQKNLNIWG